MIGDCAFCECRYLEKVKIAGSVKSIGKSAFQDCSNLTVLELGNGIKLIDSYAFLTAAV